MKIKVILMLLTLSFSSTCNAGFFTGYVVGSMGNKQNGLSTSDKPVTITSDTKDHHIISCYSTSYKNLCDVDNKYGWGNVPDHITPQQYLESLGYTKLHNLGIQLYNKNIFIIMEVSK